MIYTATNGIVHRQWNQGGNGCTSKELCCYTTSSSRDPKSLVMTMAGELMGFFLSCKSLTLTVFGVQSLLLHVHEEGTDALDFTEVARLFVSANTRRTDVWIMCSIVNVIVALPI